MCSIEFRCYRCVAKIRKRRPPPPPPQMINLPVLITWSYAPHIWTPRGRKTFLIKKRADTDMIFSFPFYISFLRSPQILDPRWEYSSFFSARLSEKSDFFSIPFPAYSPMPEIPKFSFLFFLLFWIWHKKSLFFGSLIITHFYKFRNLYLYAYSRTPWIPKFSFLFFYESDIKITFFGSLICNLYSCA